MSSPYDQSLLASAPAATRAQMQVRALAAPHHPASLEELINLPSFFLVHVGRLQPRYPERKARRAHAARIELAAEPRGVREREHHARPRAGGRLRTGTEDAVLPHKEGDHRHPRGAGGDHWRRRRRRGWRDAEEEDGYGRAGWHEHGEQHGGRGCERRRGEQQQRREQQ